ncbi:MAG TPA: hypothetical protein VFG35_26770 [Actinoplanes sp.]|nr:hypothetical protein [Actinoplanes sp.]
MSLAPFQIYAGRLRFYLKYAAGPPTTAITPSTPPRDAGCNARPHPADGPAPRPGFRPGRARL